MRRRLKRAEQGPKGLEYLVYCNSLALTYRARSRVQLNVDWPGICGGRNDDTLIADAGVVQCYLTSKQDMILPSYETRCTHATCPINLAQ
jgi:hypothetical protein